MHTRPPLALSALIVFLAGCSTSKITSTPRTGTEQLLVSNAIDQSLQKVNFATFRGQKVFINEKYVDCVDKNYLIASTRHHVSRAGAVLVPDAEKADVILELRNGSIGTDTSESFVGIPEITLPGMLTLPELRLITRSSQSGLAKIGIVALDADTGQTLGDGGVSLAKSDNNNWYVMGVGPYQNGTIRKEVSRSLDQPTAVNAPLPSQVVFQQHSSDPPGRLRLTNAADEAVEEPPAGDSQP